MAHRSCEFQSLETVTVDDLIAAWHGRPPGPAGAIAAALRAGALDRHTVERVAAGLGADGTRFRTAVAETAWRRERPSQTMGFGSEESQWLLALPIVGSRSAIAQAAAQPLFRRHLERAMVQTGFVDATSTLLFAPTAVDMATLASASPQATHDLLEAACTEQSPVAPSPGAFAAAARAWAAEPASPSRGLDVVFLLGARRAVHSEEVPLLEILEDRRVVESEDLEVDQFLTANQAVHVGHRDHLCCEDVLTAVETASEGWARAVAGLERAHGLFDIRPPVPWSAAVVDGVVASVHTQLFAPAAGRLLRDGRRDRLHLYREAGFVRMMLEEDEGLRGPALVEEELIGGRMGSLARWLADEVVWHECRTTMPRRPCDA
jgi:hypothetical protein